MYGLKNYYFLHFLLVCSLSIVFTPMVKADAKSMTARDIINCVANRDIGEDSISMLNFNIIGKKGKKRVRTLISYSKAKGEDDRMNLMIVNAPKSLLNTGFLSIDNKKDDPIDSQWIYLSALQKTKRIAAKDKSGRFIGTDFTYYDLTLLNTDRFDYQILEETTVDNAPGWKIQATARTDEIAKESGYQQSIFWVRSDPYLILKADHQTDNPKRRKEYRVNGYEKKDNNVWVITESIMKTYYKEKLQGETYLFLTDIKFNQNLEEAMFTVRRLEKGL